MHYNDVMPKWLLQEESYEPPKQRSGFIKKTMLSIVTMLSYMKRETVYKKKENTAPIVKILGAVFVILILSLNKNIIFYIILLAIFLLRMATLSGESILIILKRAWIAMLCSILILLPGAVMGNWHTWINISSKLFLTMIILGIEAESLVWNQFTAGLQMVHIPDILIFIMDITMKYIIQLGEICYSMIQALQIRSIGKSKNKKAFYFNILGVVFLKSYEQSEEMVKAMECRGFDGKFVCMERRNHGMANLLYGSFLLVLFGLFIWCNNFM